MPRRAEREALPVERPGLTHKFVMRGLSHEIFGHIPGYEPFEPIWIEYTFFLTIGCYPDGRPGEIFICVDKEGSLIRGLCDMAAVLCSSALQYGVPLDWLMHRLEHSAFGPSEVVSGIPECMGARSLADYIAKYIGSRWPDGLASNHTAVVLELHAGEQFDSSASTDDDPQGADPIEHEAQTDPSASSSPTSRPDPREVFQLKLGKPVDAWLAEYRDGKIEHFPDLGAFVVEALLLEREGPRVEPENMHGCCDQFGGTDDPGEL